MLHQCRSRSASRSTAHRYTTKVFRKKQGKFDEVKLCIGQVKPEKQWSSHHLAHDIVNSCATNAELAQAVRVLAGEVMGVAVAPQTGLGCQHCKQPNEHSARHTSSSLEDAPPPSLPIWTPPSPGTVYPQPATPEERMRKIVASVPPNLLADGYRFWDRFSPPALRVLRAMCIVFEVEPVSDEHGQLCGNATADAIFGGMHVMPFLERWASFDPGCLSEATLHALRTDYLLDAELDADKVRRISAVLSEMVLWLRALSDCCTVMGR
jgi:hypothetical protein